MSKGIEKIKAVQLRRKGWSMKEISRELNVSKGSVSLWCQGIVLTKSQMKLLKDKQIMAGHVGRQKGADMNRVKREQAIADAKIFAINEVNCLDTKDLFYLGLGIYWGEGVKSRSGQASVVNSDPRILKVMMRWFEECLTVSKSDFRPYVYISSQHKDRENIIIKYWQKVLDLPESQFKSPIYIKQKHKKFYENHDKYFGVVALRVSRSTNLKYKILALLETINERLE